MLKKLAVVASLLLFTGTFFSSNSVIYAEKFSREQLKEVKKKKESILDEINAKNGEIKKEIDKIKAAQQKINQTEDQVAKVEVQLSQAEKELKIYDDKFKERIRRLYQRGEMSYMSTLFAATSFGQFLQRFELIRVIMKEDYALIKERKLAKQKVENQLKAFQKLRDIQNAEVQKSTKAYQKLVAQQKKNNLRLDDINAIIEDHEDEIIRINLAELRSGKLRFPYTGPLKKPSKLRMTSAYGYRIHPIFHTKKLHAGIDFAGPVGTPILAAADGVVVESRPSSGYGWLITIYHGDLNGKRIYTRYAHSFPYQVKVKAGQEVTAGEQITSIGLNGNTTGPHLHFEVRVGNGNPPPSDNPTKYF